MKTELYNYGRTIKKVEIGNCSLILSLSGRTFITRRENSQFTQIVGQVAPIAPYGVDGYLFRYAYSYFRKDVSQFRAESAQC